MVGNKSMYKTCLDFSLVYKFSNIKTFKTIITNFTEKWKFCNYIKAIIVSKIKKILWINYYNITSIVD